MSENISERDLLIESLPLGANRAQWAEFEAGVLGRTPVCPSIPELIQLGRGDLPGERAQAIRGHAQDCPHCRAWCQGFAPAPDDPRAASVQRSQELAPAPSAVEEPEQPVAAEAPSGPVAWEDRPVANPSGTFNSTFMRFSPRELIGELRDVLPELLADVGLAPARAESFRQFVLAQLEKDARFASAGLPIWLERFAREDLGLRALPAQLSTNDWEVVLLHCALRYLARKPPVRFNKQKEKEEAASFYRGVVEEGVQSWQHVGQSLNQLASRTGITREAARELLHEGKTYHRSIRSRCLNLARKA